jgi:hypothetical protein
MRGRRMACVLSNSPTLDADYQGPIGSTFTVDASCATAPAAIAAAAYGSTKLTSGPFTFTIVAGITSLALIVEGSVLKSLIQIREVCPGGGTNVLRQFELTDPDHSTSGVWIKGI